MDRCAWKARGAWGPDNRSGGSANGIINLVLLEHENLPGIDGTGHSELTALHPNFV